MERLESGLAITYIAFLVGVVLAFVYMVSYVGSIIVNNALEWNTDPLSFSVGLILAIGAWIVLMYVYGLLSEKTEYNIP